MRREERVEDMTEVTIPDGCSLSMWADPIEKPTESMWREFFPVHQKDWNVEFTTADGARYRFTPEEVGMVVEAKNEGRSVVSAVMAVMRDRGAV